MRRLATGLGACPLLACTARTGETDVLRACSSILRVRGFIPLLCTNRCRLWSRACSCHHTCSPCFFYCCGVGQFATHPSVVRPQAEFPSEGVLCGIYYSSCSIMCRSSPYHTHKNNRLSCSKRQQQSQTICILLLYYSSTLMYIFRTGVMPPPPWPAEVCSSITSHKEARWPVVSFIYVAHHP